MKPFHSRFLIFVHDVAWVPAALYLAFSLRFNFGPIPAANIHGLEWTAAVSTPVLAWCFWRFGVHRGLWRYIAFPDLLRLIKAVGLGVLISGLLLFVAQRLVGVPRSALVLFPMLLLLGLVGPRVLYRLAKERSMTIHRDTSRPALIVGAGRPAAMLIRHLAAGGPYMPVAIVDPDPRLVGKEIHGVRVQGTLDDVEGLIESRGVETVLLATRDLPPEQLDRLLRLCTLAQVTFRTLPFRYIDNGEVVEEVKLRPVTIEDLLQRDPVVLDLPGIAQRLAGKVVLVTGGGGSIGSELCRQIATHDPGRLVVVDSSEYNLYRVEQDLRARFPNLALVARLGDVKQEASVETLFRRFGPQVVFHAAAYKHVPLLEANPLQAIQNNVYGTRLVADAAHRFGAERFVLISTDKAVNPTNVMGASKRAAEIYCQNLDARSDTVFITTRFGNVLGSVGSVVPLFEQQIAAGGPVTVTHPEIKRYFMTIPESVSLILQAASMGRGGEIFVLDMGEPVRIRDLAEQMIRLAGLEPYREMPIVYTGLRPGEKLYEELFHESEKLMGTDNPKILLAAHRDVDWQWLDAELADLQRVVHSGDVKALRAQLQRIVPEFSFDTGEAEAVDEATPGQPGDARHLRIVK